MGDAECGGVKTLIRSGEVLARNRRSCRENDRLHHDRGFQWTTEKRRVRRRMIVAGWSRGVAGMMTVRHVRHQIIGLRR